MPQVTYCSVVIKIRSPYEYCNKDIEHSDAISVPAYQWSMQISLNVRRDLRFASYVKIKVTLLTAIAAHKLIKFSFLRSFHSLNKESKEGTFLTLHVYLYNLNTLLDLSLNLIFSRESL